MQASPAAGPRSLHAWRRVLTRTAVVVGVLGAASCAPSRHDNEASASAPAVAPGPLAEADATTGTFRLQVLELRRVGGATIEARFALTNAASSGEPAAITNQFAAAAEDSGSIADVYLMDVPGRRKYFVLRDARHQPACSTRIAPLAPGETRTLWARFLAPPAGVVRIGVQFPLVATLLEVPIRPAEPESGDPRM